MRIAIMQPYFFPYAGYFQLMQAVDCFYLYDDARYIKRGWVNRNRILVDGAPLWFTLPVANASQNRNINEHSIVRDRRFHKLPATLAHAYGKSPHYAEVRPLLEPLFERAESNLAAFLRQTLSAVAAYLGIRTPVGLTSEIPLADGPRGQDRILEYCRAVGADAYVNPQGGRDLYDRDAFGHRGVRLHFLQPELPAYAQFGGGFIAGLSIIDVLMFNDRTAAAGMVNRFSLT